MLLAVLCSVSLWRQEAKGSSGHMLEVKDGKGRIRLATEERGDAFALVMYDTNGRARLVLQTRDDGPLVEVFDKGGTQCGFFGQFSQETWAVAVRAKEGMTSSLQSTKSGAGMSIYDKSDKPSAYMITFGEKERSDLMLCSPGGESPTKVELSSGADQTALLRFRRREADVAGMIASKEGAIAWLGDGTTNSADVDGNGVRLSFGARNGAVLTLRDSKKTPGLLVQDCANLGTGYLIGTGGTARIKCGVNAEDEPKLVMYGKSGEPTMELPRK